MKRTNAVRVEDSARDPGIRFSVAGETSGLTNSVLVSNSLLEPRASPTVLDGQYFVNNAAMKRHYGV